MGAVRHHIGCCQRKHLWLGCSAKLPHRVAHLFQPLQLQVALKRSMRQMFSFCPPVVHEQHCGPSARCKYKWNVTRCQQYMHAVQMHCDGRHCLLSCPGSEQPTQWKLRQCCSSTNVLRTQVSDCQGADQHVLGPCCRQCYTRPQYSSADVDTAVVKISTVTTAVSRSQC